MRAFVAAARIGLEPGVVLPPYADPSETPRLDEFYDKTGGLNAAGNRCYRYNQASISVSPRTGRIASYDDETGPNGRMNPDGSLGPRKVSEAQAAAFTQRFHNAAGWPGGIVAREFRDGDGTNNRSLEVVYVPAIGGVPYDDAWQALMDVNRETGKLDHFSPTFDDLPAPPPSLSPRRTLAQTRLDALGYTVGFRGASFIESDAVPFKLCVWYPSTINVVNGPARPMDERHYGATVQAALARHRGILAYTGLILGGSTKAGLYLVIDANTGAILDQVAPKHPGWQDGSPIADVSVPATPHPWRTSTDGKAWSEPATARLVPTAEVPPQGGKTILCDGRLALLATYDPTTRLFGVDGKAYRMERD